MNRKAVLVVLAVIAIVITLGSYAVLKLTPDMTKAIIKDDKAVLLYNRAVALAKSGNKEDAVNAFHSVVTNYPESVCSEKAMRQLAVYYRAKGDGVKTAYFYNRLLATFPNVKDAAEIRKVAENLNMEILLSQSLTPDSVEYKVQPKDTLVGIASRFHTTVALVKKINKLESDIISPGQKLKIVGAKFSLLVDKSANRMYLYKDGVLFKTYVVSTGTKNSTPVGKFKIEEKSVEPVWYKPGGGVVKAGTEDYQLGARWMGLSAKGYGIHGTKDENTIGSQVTNGCIRMHNADVIELYDIVPSGTEVEIVDKITPKTTK